MKSFSVTIPCKSYIKKYYTAVYGPAIELTHRSDFGDTILTKMSNVSLSKASKKGLNLEFQEYNEHIKFKLPFDLFYRIENELNQQQIYNINRFLENVFETDIFITIRVAAIFGVQRNTCIRAIADACNIILDEEITFDAIKKQEGRYRHTPTAGNHFLLSMSSPLKLKLRA